MTTATEGWGWPMLSRKEHYFVDGTALCGKWMFTGTLSPLVGERTPDDCAECFRRLAKRLAQRKT